MAETLVTTNNYDGTLTVEGSEVTHNDDGTITLVYGLNFLDNGGGTITLIAPRLVREAYEALGPWARADENVWHLLWWIDSIFGQISEVNDLVRDTDTHVGWGRLLDVDAAPDWALPWLAQFVGVTYVVGSGRASQRQKIREMSSSQRGSVEAIKASVEKLLTGTRQVELYERDGSAWHFRVRTYASETPNPSAVAQAIRMLKPAGLVFTHEVSEYLPPAFYTISNLDESAYQ